MLPDVDCMTGVLPGPLHQPGYACLISPGPGTELQRASVPKDSAQTQPNPADLSAPFWGK